MKIKLDKTIKQYETNIAELTNNFNEKINYYKSNEIKIIKQYNDEQLFK